MKVIVGVIMVLCIPLALMALAIIFACGILSIILYLPTLGHSMKIFMRFYHKVFHWDCDVSDYGYPYIF